MWPERDEVIDLFRDRPGVVVVEPPEDLPELWKISVVGRAGLRNLGRRAPTPELAMQFATAIAQHHGLSILLNVRRGDCSAVVETMLADLPALDGGADGP